jgi:hypothetical protein
MEHDDEDRYPRIRQTPEPAKLTPIDAIGRGYPASARMRSGNATQ